jgi:hypothetical protein
MSNLGDPWNLLNVFDGSGKIPPWQQPLPAPQPAPIDFMPLPFRLVAGMVPIPVPNAQPGNMVQPFSYQSASPGQGPNGPPVTVQPNVPQPSLSPSDLAAITARSMALPGSAPSSPNSDSAPQLYPGGQGGNLPSTAVMGGPDWPAGIAHKTSIPAPSDAVRNVLQCLVGQAPGPFVVSSTSEPALNPATGRDSRAPTDPHYEDKGKAFDVQALPAYRQAIIQAAALCGVPWHADEYARPVQSTTGGNIHFQLRPPARRPQ